MFRTPHSIRVIIKEAIDVAYLAGTKLKGEVRNTLKNNILEEAKSINFQKLADLDEHGLEIWLKNQLISVKRSKHDGTIIESEKKKRFQIREKFRNEHHGNDTDKMVHTHTPPSIQKIVKDAVDVAGMSKIEGELREVLKTNILEEAVRIKYQWVIDLDDNGLELWLKQRLKIDRPFVICPNIAGRQNPKLKEKGDDNHYYVRNRLWKEEGELREKRQAQKKTYYDTVLKPKHKKMRIEARKKKVASDEYLKKADNDARKLIQEYHSLFEAVQAGEATIYIGETAQTDWRNEAMNILHRESKPFIWEDGRTITIQEWEHELDGYLKVVKTFETLYECRLFEDTLQTILNDEYNLPYGLRMWIGHDFNPYDKEEDLTIYEDAPFKIYFTYSYKVPEYLHAGKLLLLDLSQNKSNIQYLSLEGENILEKLPTLPQVRKKIAATKWETWFESLELYVREAKNKNGGEWNGKVPNMYKTAEGKNLATWIYSQKCLQKRGGLSSDRECLLQEIGLQWLKSGGRKDPSPLEMYQSPSKTMGMELDDKKPAALPTSL